jgi:hypothetical protein
MPRHRFTRTVFGLAAAAAAILAPAARPAFVPRLDLETTVLRIDVDGDGRRDTVATSRSSLVVTVSGRVLVAPLVGRLDGAIRARDGSAVLLVRSASTRGGFVDAVYAIRDARLRRLDVRGGIGNGLATGLSGGTYFEPDCGIAAGSLTQVKLEAVGSRWRKTLVTFARRGTGYVRTSMTRGLVSATDAARRRCAVVRR